METMLIELTHQKSGALLQQLEELKLIRVLQKDTGKDFIKLSDKYRGLISKERGTDLNKHIGQMRSEWNSNKA